MKSYIYNWFPFVAKPHPLYVKFDIENLQAIPNHNQMFLTPPPFYEIKNVYGILVIFWFLDTTEYIITHFR